MRKYETIYIVQPDLADDDNKSLSNKVQEIIASMKGEFLKLEDWGVRKLAYPVKKSIRGRYFYLRFDADSALIAELERRLRLDDKVLRYQSVRLDDDAPSVVAVQAPAAVEETEEAVEEQVSE